MMVDYYMSQQGQQPTLPPHLVNIDTRSKPQGQQPPIYTPNILPQQSHGSHPQQVPIQNSAPYDPTMAPIGASTRRDVLPPQPQYEEFAQDLPPYQDAEFEAREAAKQQQQELARRQQAMYAQMQQELFEQQQHEAALLEKQRQAQAAATSSWSFDAMKLAAVALLAAFILPFVLHAVSLHLGYPPCNTKISAISALGVGGIVYAAQILQ